MHPASGTLRRSIDEPVALDPAQRQHLATCDRCAHRVERLRADAHVAWSVLALPDATVDVAAAHERLARSEAPAPGAGTRHARVAPVRTRNQLAGRVLAGVGVAGVASALLVATGGAQDFLSLFQPSRFAAVPVTSADVRSLAGLDSYGTVSGGSSPLNLTPEPDAASAGKAAGLPALTIGDVPPGITSTPTYADISGTVVSFRFDAALARAAAASAGKQLPPLPPGLDGSTLTVTIAPAIVVSYGFDINALLHGGGIPSGDEFVVVASRTPMVSSTGVTVQQLENYILSLPGIPPGVASEIRALGDPEQTIPVPIPIDLASASPANINGSAGLLIGDATGIGSAVLWQHNHIVYAVAGTLSADQSLAVARSVH